MSPAGVFDLLLPVALVYLADLTLRQRRHSEAIVQFMVFGLVTALAWVRVEAPDLALTEAAIGSGATGVLLLAAVHRLGLEKQAAERVPALLRLPAGAACLLIGLGLSWMLWQSWPPRPGLTAVAYEALPRSGGSNPVTAVVLNYRAWDTWLEMAVLLAATLCVYRLGGSRKSRRGKAPGPVFAFYLNRMSPIFVLVVLYTVWIGSRAPGGAFPAGALLAGLGVLGLLGLRDFPLRLEDPRLRLGLSLGCGAFLLACLVLWSQGGALLEFPPGIAKWLILAIELACAASIGLSLTLLFAACAGWLTHDSGDAPS